LLVHRAQGMIDAAAKGGLRDARGRFVPDPANPPSPYRFTDAQRRAE
jgi:hypothetical protein